DNLGSVFPASTVTGAALSSTCRRAPRFWNSPRRRSHRFNSPAFVGGFIGGDTEVAVAAFPGLYWHNEYRFAAYGAAALQFFVNGVPFIGVVNHESKNV